MLLKAGKFCIITFISAAKTSGNLTVGVSTCDRISFLKSARSSESNSSRLLPQFQETYSYLLVQSLEMHWKTMMTLFLFQCFCFIVVLGQRQGSKSALMKKVTSDPKRNIHCVIYFTDKSSGDLAITGLSVPAIIYHYRKNGYIILMFLEEPLKCTSQGLI